MNTQLLLQTTTIVTILGLSYLSLWDIKYKRIPTMMLIYLSGYGLINQLLLIGEPKEAFFNLFIALGVSAVFLTLAVVSKQQLGLGDVLLYFAIALINHWQMALVVYLAAFILAGIYGLSLLLLFKKSKKTELALVPFILVSYLLVVLIP